MSSVGGRPAERGGLQHLVGVMFITRRHVVGGRRPSTRLDGMSDHTERLRKLRDRILAAKEFL
jgi:hypothetical protein